MYDGIGSRLAWLAVLLLLYLWFCFRVAIRVSETGRRLLPWFFINVFFTAIPAAVVLYRHRRRKFVKRREANEHAHPGSLKRCRHCGEYLFIDSNSDQPATCPQCGMKLDEEYYA